MAQRKTIVPKASAIRILMKAGAKRVSEGAAEAFVEVIEDIAGEIANKASRIAKHSGRKTVDDGDVKLAAK